MITNTQSLLQTVLGPSYKANDVPETVSKTTPSPKPKIVGDVSKDIQKLFRKELKKHGRK